MMLERNTGLPLSLFVSGWMSICFGIVPVRPRNKFTFYICSRAWRQKGSASEARLGSCFEHKRIGMTYFHIGRSHSKESPLQPEISHLIFLARGYQWRHFHKYLQYCVETGWKASHRNVARLPKLFVVRGRGAAFGIFPERMSVLPQRVRNATGWRLTASQLATVHLFTLVLQRLWLAAGSLSATSHVIRSHALALTSPTLAFLRGEWMINESGRRLQFQWAQPIENSFQFMILGFLS